MAWGCLSPPRPTEESLRIGRNTPAAVEGTVRDRQGRPVSDVAVQGMPRGKDLPWFPPATTDSAGRFRLLLAAPGTYGFVLSWRGRTVVTPLPDDPARLQIAVEPGGHREGIELVFLQEEWEKVLTSLALVRDLRPLGAPASGLGRTRPRPRAWSLTARSLPRREAPPLGYFAETPRAAKARKEPNSRGLPLFARVKAIVLKTLGRRSRSERLRPKASTARLVPPSLQLPQREAPPLWETPRAAKAREDES